MPEPYEIRCEPEAGVNLTTGRPWTGIRIRYRELGSRGRWRTLLLDAEGDQPTIDQLQHVCAVHEGMADLRAGLRG